MSPRGDSQSNWSNCIQEGIKFVAPGRGAAELSYAVAQIVNCLDAGRSSALERPFFSRESKPASAAGHRKCISAGKATGPSLVSSSQWIALGRGLRLQHNRGLGAFPRSIATPPWTVLHPCVVWRAAGNDCSAAGAYPRWARLEGSSGEVARSTSYSIASTGSADTDASRRKQTDPRNGA